MEPRSDVCEPELGNALLCSGVKRNEDGKVEGCKGGEQICKRVLVIDVLRPMERPENETVRLDSARPPSVGISRSTASTIGFPVSTTTSPLIPSAARLATLRAVGARHRSLRWSAMTLLCSSGIRLSYERRPAST